MAAIKSAVLPQELVIRLIRLVASTARQGVGHGERTRHFGSQVARFGRDIGPQHLKFDKCGSTIITPPIRQQLSSQQVWVEKKYSRPGSFNPSAPFEYEPSGKLRTCFVQLTELYSCTSVTV
ncbi:hypothetical protein PV04_08541 [Phialophora macrospora]|uniref:Uncharacterized protein n=1 Tax=Phialophora macrospora TaxID=1851006 RepID=A0A0D2F6K1_9EURO|nr:hypothetical protein PV04_08541 [Phialophora macrospora]